MSALDIYWWIVSVVRQNAVTERLFLASIELTLLAAVVGIIAVSYRTRRPRFVTILWVMVLAKPLVSLFLGSPIAVLNLAEHPGPLQTEVSHALKVTPVVQTSLAVPDVAAPKSFENPRVAPCIELPPAEAGPILTNTEQAAPSEVQDSSWDASTWLLLVWSAGGALMFAVAVSRQARLGRILSSACEVDEQISRRLGRLAQQSKIRWIPTVRVTEQLDSPALAGIFHPVILIPRWLTAPEHANALEWSLRHELMHWKVGDPGANWLSGVAKCLFFFHPLVWWSARQWRYAMELACDRALVKSVAEARSYAEGLYHVLKTVKHRRPLALPSSIYVARTQIGKRIEILLCGTTNFQAPSNPLILGVLLLLCAASLTLGGQFQDGLPAHSSSDLAPSLNEDQAVRATPVDEAEDDTSRPTIRLAHVTVEYSDVSPSYAQAIARTVETAREVASNDFGFDMPESIRVALRVDPSSGSRLFNDGDRHFSLTVRSEANLAKPSRSGTFHIYGLCHEVGHLAMYRPIQNRSWMTTAAAEGWAHYLGSRLVDAVYEREGQELWPDTYDYRKDGTSRLEQQLAEYATATDVPETTLGAKLWKQLAEVAEDRQLAEVFRQWGQADLNSTNVGDQLGDLLTAPLGEEPARRWWARAESAFVVERQPSRFVSDTIRAHQLANHQELKMDSGTPDGKQSIAGSGHAVRFEVENDSTYLTGIRIHGARYGLPQPPKEDFHVWLCDKDFNEIEQFSFPYSKFARGSSKWISLKVKPTLVPRDFIVCVGFNPTARKGVFVSRDNGSDGASYTGLPGRPMRAYDQGNWLIRASVGTASTTRVWTDTTGKFSVKAEFQGMADEKVQLKKENGEIISVPLEKLSDTDRRYIEQNAAKSASGAPSSVSLSGKPQELKNDDGQAAGKRSFPQGFAVAFSAENDSSYLTSVRIHGARYGPPQAPQQDFYVSVCDSDFQLIAEFPMKYAEFKRGDSKWISLKVQPTKVPQEFIVCVDFRPTRSNGVYVSHDAEGRGLMGTPGKRAGSFSGGDWLIRASIDQPK